MRWKLPVGVLVSIGAIALLGSAFAPVLCRSREPANRVKCASNLRQIGTALSLYAREHGVLPDSFITLGKTEDLVPEVFSCPSSNSERAASFDGLLEKGHCDYVYLGAGLTEAQTLKSADAERIVLAYEDLDDHDRDGINILFADGQVTFYPVSRKTTQQWYVNLTNARAPTTQPIVIGPQ